GPLSFDLVYFDSTIWHHIQQLPVGSAITSTTYQWINVPVEETSGLEWQASYDFAQLAEWKGYQLEPYVTGDYDFEYNDRGVNSLTNDHIIGTPEYQTTFGLRGGKFGKWSADFYAIVLGANYEAPLTQNVPGGTTPSGAIVVAPIASSITLNTTESYVINKYVSLFFGVNNILNKNYDPNFFALNNSPTSVAATDKPGSVSGDGISAVGREFFGGFKVSF
ncbi:MAG TPA: TonB-dependent receptor, partial [Candidatus Methylacidiphilales bacterium]